ncbi:MAG: hypothetical protein US11_C0007G0010 [Candidatus Roizmanbacteria bacterium GW2011_GWA2_36_23]|uniref:PrgI family protein n=1 Tax=Candidatus Roizmanbacteria bacterium GW2011_GWA2_36_23 TaxID=1618480 RepID=A0A0G0E7P1_9BACT|nr:MAG: hypothetical protein US11_C0007G0010 [Candidatus Roizmanbacteria bacterium GW2011_GWA2_36_23]
MDQHPIPRQITTFEFKLIGFLTIKQFIYLVVFVPLGILTYMAFPIPIINILLAVCVGGIGVALAFFPINDRPLDIWIRNLYHRLTSPTQYQYHKQNHPLYFLKDLVFVSDPHRVLTHIESQQKLTKYLANTAPAVQSPNKQGINQLLHQPSSVLFPSKQSEKSAVQTQNTAGQSQNPQTQTIIAAPVLSSVKTPFFTGVVKNHKMIPLSGILIYVKDQKGAVIRLLKTNPHGVFATFSALSVNEYNFEIKDPNNSYFFDTMKIKVEANNQKPFEFYSKELL